MSFSSYLEDDIYNFRDTFKVTTNDLFTTYKSQFGLTADDQMVKGESSFLNEDSLNKFDFGTVSTRYHQYYKGLEVEQKMFNVFSKCAVVIAVNGSVVQNINIDTSSHLSDSAALSLALSHLNSPLGYSWQYVNIENSYKTLFQDDSSGYYDTSRTTYPKGKLVITKRYGENYEDNAESYALCWKFQIGIVKSTVRDSMITDSGIVYNVLDTFVAQQMVYVNASTGDIWADYDPAVGNYFTTGKVWTWAYGDKYDLNTSTCGTCRYILRNNRNIWATWASKSVLDVRKENDNLWVCCTKERDPATALWSLQKSWDYYATQQGVSRGNNLVVASNYPDKFGAFYISDGDEDYITMMDAGVSGITSSAGLDLMGHEFTHREINRTTKVGMYNYNYTEAAMVGEGLADIFGLLTETWVLGSCDWNVGNTFFGGAFKRKFYDPENDINPGPDGSCIDYNTKTNFYTNFPYGGAGIIRKWFNHLALGAPNWNTPFTPVTLTKAGRLAFITMYWNIWGGTEIYDLRAATLGVAEIHFGGRCSPVWNAVEKAWADVGVGTKSPCNNLRIVSPRVVNTDWILNDTVVKIAVVPTECETGTAIVSNYQWLLPEGWSGVPSNNGSVITLNGLPSDHSSKEVAVRVTYLDCSGASQTDTLKTVLHLCDSCNNNAFRVVQNQSNPIHFPIKDIKIFPNPASGLINVVLPDDIAYMTGALLDITGSVVKEVRLQKGNNSVSIEGIASGLYILKLNNEDKVFTRKITIQ